MKAPAALARIPEGLFRSHDDLIDALIREVDVIDAERGRDRSLIYGAGWPRGFALERAKRLYARGDLTLAQFEHWTDVILRDERERQ